jgi:hypothetical protein
MQLVQLSLQNKNDVRLPEDENNKYMEIVARLERVRNEKRERERRRKKERD